MRIARIILLAASLFIKAVGSAAGVDGRPNATANAVVTPLSSTNLHNLFRATTRVYSGSSPEGAAAFAELKQLGVKTIISVDGAKPDVDAARRHGLRYIHLPIGYDGVPTNRMVELASAAHSQPGPIYVHCHHGKHRGPAAVAVMGAVIAGWTTNQAVTWLKEAGTAADYPGLYRSAMEFPIKFRWPGGAPLDGIVELPEVARTSSLVESMVNIDAEFDRLKAAQEAGWSKIPNEADLVPAHTATMLSEYLRELARTDDTAQRPEEYRARLAGSEKATGHLRALLHDAKADPAARDAAFQAVGKSCLECHKQYRN